MRTVVVFVLIVTATSATSARADDDGILRMGVDLLDGMAGVEWTAAPRPQANLQSHVPVPARRGEALFNDGTEFIFWISHVLIGYEFESFSGAEKGSEFGGIVGGYATQGILGERFELHIGGRNMDGGSSELYLQPRAVVGIHGPSFGGIFGGVYVGVDLRPVPGIAAGGYLAMQIGRW
jgi:hypothetical protein